MNEVTVIDYKKSYQEYRTELHEELNRAAESFVRIGYLLKVARDTNILSDSGYATVTDFAAAEFGLDKSQVSRFININDRFSKGGYSEELEERYKGFGYAKLVLMLQLPDSLNEELTSDFTKSEIQAIKDEVDEEKKITDLEVLMEGEQETTAVMETDLDKTIKQLGQDNAELFREIYEPARQQDFSVSKLQGIMCPAGQKLYSIRISGIGRKELILKDKDNGNEVVLIDLRSGEKTKETWEELMGVWENLIKSECDTDCRSLWEKLYMQEWPIKAEPEKKPEVAPVQPKKPKESKVVKAKAPEKPKPAAAVEEPEEQLPGQMELTKDFQEYVPEPMKNTEVIDAEVREIAGQHTESDNAGQSDGGGTAGDAVEPGEVAWDVGETQNAEEIRTRVMNMAASIRKFEDVWKHTEDIPTDALMSAHVNAINMAAGIEKLLLMRGKHL